MDNIKSERDINCLIHLAWIFVDDIGIPTGEVWLYDKTSSALPITALQGAEDIAVPVLLEWEQNHWQTVSGKYTDFGRVLKKRLKLMHTHYPLRTEREMIKHGDYVYFEENGCICRFQQDIGEESLEVLVSLDDLGLPDHLIQRIRISPKQGFLAFTLKGSEREESTCIVLNLRSGPQVEHCIPNTLSFEWVSDSILFHTRQENLHCHHVYVTDFSNDCANKLVYKEQDSRFFVDIYSTRDKRFLTINSNSKSTSEVWLVDTNRPLEPPFLVQQRVPGMVYHVEHRQDYLYILTTYGKSAEYKLMRAPLSCDLETWKVLYEVKSEGKVVDMEMSKDHCVMFLKYQNQPHLEVISLSNAKVQSIKLPAWACAFECDPHTEYEASDIHFYLTSPIQYPVLFVHSLLENRLSVEASYNASSHGCYRTEKLQAKSQDGTLVPVTVFYKASGEDLKQRPLLIHVYGAYGMDLNMSFKVEKRMLVDDGWILAYCHVRGGGELGCSWHKEGILDKKQNGLDDLRACIKHLHEVGFSQSRHTALEASSGGGVLAGALYNTDPGLFQAMVLEAPFLNVLNTMMDTSLPLTIEEQEELGDPISNHKYSKCMKTYCPYQNIKPQNYPSVLITAYDNDQRIPLEGLLRYTKKLRKAVDEFYSSKTMSVYKMPTILLHVLPGGSHCDSLTWEDSLQKVSMHLAFLYKELNIMKRDHTKKRVN
ncbi:prolyl endopeptidase-like [Pelodytes ibericus]